MTDATATNATVQICKDNDRLTLIKQIPKCTILEDGRIKVKTSKGMGFLVSKDACQSLNLDPAKAVFDSSMIEAHYRINQSASGKVVRAYVSEPCVSIVNPEWIAYNNGMNEGGEGYNPHPKHIVTQKSQVRYL
jgi:hypothetical protein